MSRARQGVAAMHLPMPLDDESAIKILSVRPSVCPSVRPSVRPSVWTKGSQQLQDIQPSPFFCWIRAFPRQITFFIFGLYLFPFQSYRGLRGPRSVFFSIFGLKFSWMLGNTYCKSIKLGIYVVLNSNKNFWSIFFGCHAHLRPFRKSSITSVFVGIFRLKFNRTFLWCSSIYLLMYHQDRTVCK